LRYKLLLLVIALILIIAVSLFVTIDWFNNYRQSTPEFLVGVECAYGNVRDLKDLVDKVKTYTNLFVIGSLEISFNQTALNETCDYIYTAGLYFIVFFTSRTNYNYNPDEWINKSKQKYGDRLLGTYRYDEPGGNQLDRTGSNFVVEAKDNADAAKTFVDYLYLHIEYYLYSSPKMFTADYGLYWFDYKGGYDTVFAEFGWNHSRHLNVALCRGAAKAQNKNWGAIVTWTYNNTPYIEHGDALYNDMILAYQNGAKYVVVFDYPQIERYGILTEEHFDALKKFWNYTHSSPQNYGVDQGKVAYVLPSDYGFGFRSINDAIWGLWKADERSEKIWDDVNKLLDQYGFRLDIVYDDPEFSIAIKSRYDKLIFWNETVT
jgi:hypothetical protein